MSRSRKMMVLAVAAVCLIAVASVNAQQDKPLYPIGRITFETTSIAAGVGVSWGHGMFTFEGKQYPISVKGLGLGAVGIAKVNAVGDVFNLKNASDLAGTYVGISGGIAIAGGAKGILARNQHGVVLDIHATQQGVSLNIGTDGFTISMQ
ncbi:MAG: hypothetical protein P8168_12770 [Deltaproteobacteria bacterium]